jgi:ribonuclease P protein component
LFFIKKNSPGSSLNLFIIKKKYFSLAVTRNKLKRRIKNILKELGFSHGLVIICKPGADRFSYNELKIHAEGELRKLDEVK